MSTAGAVAGAVTATRAFLLQNARWLGAGVLLAFISSVGQTFFIALFSAEIRAAFGLSDGEFGSLYAAATIASAVTLVWLGQAADSVHLRRVVTLMVAGLASMALAMALVPSIWLLGFVIFGLRLFGQGMMTHLAVTAMARWFVANRGRAVSIVAFGLPIGEAILPALVVLALGTVGWRMAWGIGAGIVALVVLPVLWVLLAVDREPRSRGEVEREPPRATSLTRAQVLRLPSFYGLLAGTMAPAFIMTGMFFHQVRLSEEKGWALSLYASAFVAYAASTVIAALLGGWVADRWGAMALLRLFLLPLAMALCVLAFGSGEWVAWGFLALAGATSGLSSTLSGVLWPTLYGLSHIGAIRALSISAAVLASAAAPAIFGWLIDTGVTLTTIALACLGYTMFAVVLLFALMPRFRRQAAGA